MKLRRVSTDKFGLELDGREKTVMVELLRLYPRVPSTFMPISKSGSLPDPAGSQKLIDEALAEQRSENKRLLQQLLDDPVRWTAADGSFRATFDAAELDWLLQILNDIRVGSWMILGSPDEPLGVVNQETAPHLWAMEMAGFFQTLILHALESGDA